MDEQTESKTGSNFEFELLASALTFSSGINFSDYAQPSLKRRLLAAQSKFSYESLASMIHDVLHNDKRSNEIQQYLSITTTEMFRTPLLFKEIRNKILPVLRSYPYLNIWHAGCATGQEAYSMAIILKELDMLRHSQVYATDYNLAALSTARSGVYSLDKFKAYTQNYLSSGGESSFSQYYFTSNQLGMLHQDIKQNILFSKHNLTTDATFGEMQIIMCRNVFIYFNKTLQDKILELFNSCLSKGGYLILGDKETISHSSIVDDFEVVDSKLKIYRKTY